MKAFPLCPLDNSELDCAHFSKYLSLSFSLELVQKKNAPPTPLMNYLCIWRVSIMIHHCD